MKKIPCLFVREFVPRANGKGIDAILTRTAAPGLEWVLAGDGIATRKWDGTACMVKDGVLHKRYDAKKGKIPPPGAVPCDEPDPVTGHWPHWMAVDKGDPASKWHFEAWVKKLTEHGKGTDPGPAFPDGTYELVGPHVAPHEEHPGYDIFHRHGADVLSLPAASRTFEGLQAYFATGNIEGIVFWKDGEPRCKIRRADFGMPWGGKNR